MIFQKAFYKTIDLLETYYDNHKQDDAIITILSDLDCTIFEDGKPVDQAVYTDWKNLISTLIKNEELSDNDMKDALINFLIYYQEEFGYKLEDAIDYMYRSMDVLQLLTCVKVIPWKQWRVQHITNIVKERHEIEKCMIMI